MENNIRLTDRDSVKTGNGLGKWKSDEIRDLKPNSSSNHARNALLHFSIGAIHNNIYGLLLSLHFVTCSLLDISSEWGKEERAVLLCFWPELQPLWLWRGVWNKNDRERIPSQKKAGPNNRKVPRRRPVMRTSLIGSFGLGRPCGWQQPPSRMLLCVVSQSIWAIYKGKQ